MNAYWELSSWCQNYDLEMFWLLVDPLQGSDSECSCFSCSSLWLTNQVSSLDDGNDSFLLDRRGWLEPIAVDPSEEIMT